MAHALLFASAALAFADPALAPPNDTVIAVGGYQMHLVIHRGSVPVVLVMESGGGANLGAWAGVDSMLVRRTGATVVTYDRAGFGSSTIGPADITPRDQVRHLHEALDRLGTPRDRVLIGTSYGGLMSVLHARMFPDRVRGLVLVDPMNPRFVAATGDFIHTTVPKITDPKTGRDSALARMIRTFPTLIADPDVGDEGVAAPIVVVTAGEKWFRNAMADSAWRASHQAMVGAGGNRRLSIAVGSGHDVAASRPDLVVEAVGDLLRDFPKRSDQFGRGRER